MSVTAQQPRLEPPVRARVRWLAAALLIGWVVALAAIVLLGERSSTLARLEGAAAAGEVHSVELAGELRGDPTPPGRGFSVVEVHWREGLQAFTTEVLVTRGGAPARGAADEDVTARIDEPLGPRLQALQPGLEVRHVGRSEGLTATIAGWHLTGLPAALLLVTLLATVALLVLGPEPRGATRWAWFWLLISAAGPLVAPAFLLLGGALTGTPAAGGRRLTGGWAFLLAVLLTVPLAA